MATWYETPSCSMNWLSIDTSDNKESILNTIKDSQTNRVRPLYRLCSYDSKAIMVMLTPNEVSKLEPILFDLNFKFVYEIPRNHNMGVMRIYIQIKGDNF